MARNLVIIFVVVKKKTENVEADDRAIEPITLQRSTA